ncbi:hypothetical protein Q5752_006990 [Cryptotrichosporon argae]
MSTPLLQQFPSLSTYPDAFLKDLLSDPALVEAFLFTLPEVQALAAEVEQLGKENEELARQNLALEDGLVALRDATEQAYAHAEGMKRQWADIDKAQTNLYSKFRPSFLHLRLKHSLTAQDEASEKIAAAFIESGASGNGSGAVSRVDSPAPGASDERPASVLDRSTSRPLDDFVTEFKAARKTYHKRAIWAERWSRGEVAWRDD